MAQLAKTYHNELQSKDLSVTLDDPMLDATHNTALQHIHQCVPGPCKNELAKYLTQAEIRQALCDLPNGKATGLDGIPHELWRHLAERKESAPANQPDIFDIVKLLTLVYNDIEHFGIAPNTKFSQGWMCPLYKKGDRTHISNY
jgi:hypothetical protein